MVLSQLSHLTPDVTQDRLPAQRVIAVDALAHTSRIALQISLHCIELGVHERLWVCAMRGRSVVWVCGAARADERVDIVLRTELR